MTRVVVTFIFLILLLGGCEASNETILDEQTQSDVVVLGKNETDSSLIQIHYRADNMDRGNLEYFDNKVGIEPNVELAEITRGTIVLYQDEFLSRVVGLPGETIQIIESEVYINGAKLDSFYANAHRIGIDNKEDYLEAMALAGTDVVGDGEDIYNYNMEEVTLSQNQFFVISDDWFRGNKESIEFEQINGFVKGIIQQ